MTEQPYPPLRPQPPVRGRTRPNPWPMIAGVAVLAVLAIAMLLILLTRGDDPPSASGTSPSPSGSQPPSASDGAATPTAEASGTSPSSSPTAGVGPDSVVALAVDRLALRDGPGLSAEAEWRLAEGTLAFVIDGPAEADGLPWYQISGMGLPFGSGCITPPPGEILECPAFLGWVAGAGEDGTAYLVPTDPPPCEEPPHTLESLAGTPYTVRLICFGTEPITLTAWLPDEAPAPDEDCPAADDEIGWLACQATNPIRLAADEGAGDGLSLFIDPASDIAVPERGQWIQVTAHHDDAAATRCADVADVMERDPGELVFECRLQLVATAVSPTSAP